MRFINAKIILDDNTEDDFKTETDATVFQEFLTFYNMKEQRTDFKLVLEEE